MDPLNEAEVGKRLNRRLSALEAEPVPNHPRPWLKRPGVAVGRSARASMGGLVAGSVIFAAVLAFAALRGGWLTSGTGAQVPTDQDSVMRALCAGPATDLASHYGSNGSTLVAEFASTGAKASAWILAAGQSVVGDPKVAGDAKWEPIPSAATVAYCYFEGDYTGFPQAPGADVEYTRMLILAPSGGAPEIFAVGTSAMSLAGPAAAAP